MTTPPLSRGQRIDKYAADRSVSWDEAAKAIALEDERAVELAETDDPAVLLPAIRDGINLRAEIEHISKTISNPSYYTIHTDRGPVPLGASSNWATRPNVFAAAFLDNVHEMPVLPSGQRRLDIFSMIARAAVPVSIGEEATDAGWTRAALRDYLCQRPPAHTVDEALGSEYPFVGADGRVCIVGRAFTRWLLLTYQERLSSAALGLRLRAVGGEPDKINVGKGADRTSRSIWRLPSTLDE